MSWMQNIEDALESSFSPFIYTAQSVSRGHTPQIRVHSARQHSDNLKNSATIGTFLAAVQAQMLAFSVANPSTNLLAGVNALAFAGIILDVIGALFALFSAQQLLRAREILDSIHEYADACERPAMEEVARAAKDVLHGRKKRARIERYLARDLLWRVLKRVKRENAEKNADGAEDGSEKRKSEDDSTATGADTVVEGTQRGLWRTDPDTSASANPWQQRWPSRSMSTPSILRDVHQPLEFPGGGDAVGVMCKLGRVIELFGIMGDSASLATLLGFACFVASVLSLALATQPPAVYIATGFAVGCIVILPIMTKIFDMFITLRSC